MSFTHKIFFVVFTASIFVKLDAMSHNWPHYKSKIGPDICTCTHMEAIIEYFKDKKDLTMVLGAGDGLGDKDYERLKGYDFVVCEGYYSLAKTIDPSSLFGNHIFSKSKNLEKQTIDETLLELQQYLKNGEPILIPLNFNGQSFANFLDIFSNKFKEITFDHQSADYAENWDGPSKIIEKLFNALQFNGEFYTEAIFKNAFSFLPPELTRRAYDNELCVKATGKLLTDEDVINTFIINSLKKVGFKAQIRNDKILSNKQNLSFLKHGVRGDTNYIYACKSTILEKKLYQLKESLIQLKSKLQTINTRLETLNVTLGH
ncbi:MAG: hypothetical protein WCS92_04870 [Candidatus Babeliales bacterium]|jgi:hypothetical protein